MEGARGLLRGGSGSGGGGGSGATSNESTVSKVEQGFVGMASEVSSYGAETELELGLGLSLGSGRGGGGGQRLCGRILTAKDFPSVAARFSGAVSGTKRAADSAAQDGGSATNVSQVVGWPPIRAYRMNSLVNQAKAPRAEEDKSVSEKDKSKDTSNKKINNGNNNNAALTEKGHLRFVKVNMDGIPIGRKVNLNAHACYQSLGQTLEDMFLKPTTTINSICRENEQTAKPSKLLDGSSEFVLTYEDKEGDWMLVGDVPWGMFLSTVKRLRIMRTSEANGLAPRSQETNERQKQTCLASPQPCLF